MRSARSVRCPMVPVRKRSWLSFEVSPRQWERNCPRLPRGRTEPRVDDIMSTELRSILAAVIVGAALFAGAPLATADGQQPSQPAGALSGIITTVSAVPFDSTLARLERAITSRGITIAARVDHAAA